MNSKFIFFGVVAIVLGLVFAAAAWTTIVPYREDTSNAETVDAVVVSSDVVEGWDTEAARTTYTPTVTYRYTYGGTEYTSSSVFPGDINPVTDRSRAREIVDRYPPDEEVTAYVNTENPETAFLVDRSAPLWYWAGPVVGGLMILYGLSTTVKGIRGVEPASQSF